MWSKFVLGAAAPDHRQSDEAEEEEENHLEPEEELYEDDELADVGDIATTPQYTNNSLLGNRFSYMGEMATRIMAQVAPTSSAEDNEVDAEEDEVTNAWENEVDELDFSASERHGPPLLEMAQLEAPIVESTSIPAPTIDNTVWDEDDYNYLDLTTGTSEPVPEENIVGATETAEVSTLETPASEDLYPTIVVNSVATESHGVAMAMVDHTPQYYSLPDEEATGGAQIGTVSVATLAESEDLTRDTCYAVTADPHGLDVAAENVSVYVNNDDDEDVYDLENEHSYGPVVDHTPIKAPIPLQRSSSLAVQGARETTFHSNSRMDDTVSDAGWADDTTFDESSMANASEKKALPLVTTEEGNLVDLTPATVAEDSQPLTDGTAISLRALASLGETNDVEPDDGKEMDEQHAFGLVVDITPPTEDVDGNAPPIVAHSDVTLDGADTILSMAVNHGEIQGDFAEDEAMEDTCFGDSTVCGAFTDGDDENEAPGDGWASEEDDAVLASMDDDDEVTQPNIPPLIAMSEPKRTTFSSTLTSFESPLVDHTPSELFDTVSTIESQPINPSVIALATSEDEMRDAGIESDDDADVYDDENEEQFGPVVDHTPQQTPRMVRSDFQEAVGIHLPTLTQGDSNLMLDLTSFNGSGGETDAAAVGGVDDWGEDDEDDEYDETDIVEPVVVVPTVEGGALVDHTPSEIDSPTKQHAIGGQSVQVLGSVATNTVDTVDEGDSMVDANIVYGPVVDQTPTTPATSAALFFSRSDSVLVQGKDDVDSMDTTVVGGGSRIDYGDDTVDGEAPSAIMDSEEKDEDQVVDFIPSRFESQHGDGSTFVAADPSEVLSEVDDLVPEEQNFGPVVDLTPLAHVVEVLCAPSGEGSTVVFAPQSVAADDLDPEDEGDADTELAGWTPNEDEEPNPQSGNDEHPVVNHMNEQLVDFLPPANSVGERSNGDATREALSEMTVAGGQSLLHVGDPIEDDFGPVVDQIPSVARSHESTATQLSPSECQAMEKDDRVIEEEDSSCTQAKANIVVDHLPLMERKRPIDSMATRGKSFLSEEDEEEEEDASKFGPVVDHLPASRSSLAPSHGGSTVDALATVSEVNSDDEEVDAWDDYDVDFDASFGGVSETASRHTSTASVLFRPQILASAQSIDTDRSVRFDPSLNIDPFEVQQKANPEIDFSVPDDTQYYDPRVPSVPTVALDETKSTVTSFLSGRPHETTEKSFSEADTPPSTPYRRPEGLNLVDQFENGEEFSLPCISKSQCKTCDSVQTAACPCVQRLLLSNIQFGTVFGFLETSDGRNIKIDFSQLLQDEITRRHLVEAELDELKLKSQRSMGLENEFLELRHIKDESSSKILAAETDACLLRKMNSRLLDEIHDSKALMSTLETTRACSIAKESALEAEVESLKFSLSSGNFGENVVAENEIVSLQLQLAEKSGECIELSSKLEQLENRMLNANVSFAEKSSEASERSLVLEETIVSLNVQLSESESLLKSTELSRVKLEGKLKALDLEIGNLRSASTQVAALQIQHEKDLQQQYGLLDAKSSEIRSLESALSTLQKEKVHILADLTHQRALAEQSGHLADELIAVAKERDLFEKALNESKEAMVSLQTIIEEHGAERQLLDLALAAEKTTLKDELEVLRESLKIKQEETLILTSQTEELTCNNNLLTRNLSEMEKTLLTYQDVVKQAKLDAANERNKASLLDREISILKNELSDTSSTRDNLVLELQRLSVNSGELHFKLKLAEEESNEHASRNLELTNEVARLSDLASALSEERRSLLIDLEESNDRCHSFEMKYTSSLKDFEETVKRLAKAYDDDIAELKEKDYRLHDELLRLQEAESHHAAALEEVERSAHLESLQYGDQTSLLISDCVELREKLYLLEKWKELSSSDTNVDAPSFGEYSDLRREHTALTSELSNVHESHRLLKEKYDVLEKKTLTLQRDFSEQEIARNQLRPMLQQEAAEVTKLQAKCNTLIGEVEQLRTTANHCTSEIGHPDHLLLEHNRLKQENEEMLVQFGMLKQHMDQYEESERMLHAELNAMRLVSLEQSSAYALELEQIRGSHASLQEQIESLLSERDALLRQHQKLSDEESRRAENFVLLEQHNQDIDLRLRQAKLQLELSEAKFTEQSSELLSLKQSNKKIELLESTLNEKMRQITILERRLEDTDHSTMKGNMISEDDWLSLQKQVNVLNQALQSTRDRLALREADVDRLSVDIRELRHFPQLCAPVDVTVSSAIASKDCSSLVTRAANLRRTDSIRAAAMQRLEAEREASAEALRRLCESVTKYYNDK